MLENCFAALSLRSFSLFIVCYDFPIRISVVTHTHTFSLLFIGTTYECVPVSLLFFTILLWLMHLYPSLENIAKHSHQSLRVNSRQWFNMISLCSLGIILPILNTVFKVRKDGFPCQTSPQCHYKPGVCTNIPDTYFGIDGADLNPFTCAVLLHIISGYIWLQKQNICTGKRMIKTCFYSTLLLKIKSS